MWLLDCCVSLATSAVSDSYADFNGSFAGFIASFAAISESFADFSESFADFSESFANFSDSFADFNDAFSVDSSLCCAVNAWTDIAAFFSATSWTRASKALICAWSSI